LTGVVALVFLVLHLPYLPSSLEDLDSINFALGIQRFDVAQHRPHPPGYPLFILIAKTVNWLVASEIVALALMSVVAGALGVLVIAALFRRAQARDESPVWPLVATAVTVTSPLYWFTAVRPLSDMTGLTAALGVQAMTLAVSSTWGLMLASGAAGVATGVRSQVAWLTLPLLLVRGLGAGRWGLRQSVVGSRESPVRSVRPQSDRSGSSSEARSVRLEADRSSSSSEVRSVRLQADRSSPAEAGHYVEEHCVEEHYVEQRYVKQRYVKQHTAPNSSRQSSVASPWSMAAGLPTLAAVAASFTTGVLVWFVPLVVVSGGPGAYWRALFDQGAEDLGNIQMLWTHHDLRMVAQALYYAFVAPWAAWPLAAVVVVLALVGLLSVGRRAPRAAVWLAAGFGPYLLFDLLFQETFTGRYALPLVVPMAYLAVEGARRLTRPAGVAVAIGIAMFGAHVGGTSIAAYSRQQAPAFQLLDDMRTVAGSLRDPPVLAMDRRESLDFRRPIAWVDAAMPRLTRTLPAPPQREWLEAVNYWNGGGDAPVWFVVDPKRSSIELVQHGPPGEYRWSLPYPTLLSGARPNEMDWYRVDQPDWYVGEGWSLTPETAGVAERDRRGLPNGSITAWIKVQDGPPRLLIGGRNLEPLLRPRITVRVAGKTADDWTVMPGFFLRSVALPDLDKDRAPRYLPIEIVATPPSRVAIEQFDASLVRPLAGFAEGWYEPEFNPETGRRWRWLSERGQLTVVPPTASVAAPVATSRPALRDPNPSAQLPAVGSPVVSRLTLHLEGESPRKYFSRASHLVVRAEGRTLFDAPLADDFTLDIPIPDPHRIESIVLETDQVFTPADRSRRTADRRRLGLRIFKCEVREANR
jgi:hypothetical protein